MTIAAILRHKGHEVATVAPTATLAEVAQQLLTKRIGAVLVLDRADQLLGIVSERDVVRALPEHAERTLTLTAAQVMTQGLHVTSPNTPVEAAMAQMTTNRVRHLPVLEDGKLVGLVSIGDVVKAVLNQRGQEVDSLKAYVAGGA